MKKRILVFGATGGTGQELLKQTIQKGHHVTAFVRDPKKLTIKNKNLKVIKGDVLNYSDVSKAVKDQDVVFCSLGMHASDKTNLRTQGTSHIVKAMESLGVERFICQTSLGFDDSKEVLPWHMKYLIVPIILKNAFKDHASQEKVIAGSKLKWTIVRPGNMTNKEKTEVYQHGFEPTEKITLKISRADVAHFMIRQVNNTEYLYKKAGISY